jgi:hypothetical protein
MTMDVAEQWAKLSGTQHYRLSSHGRVLRVAHTTKRVSFRTGETRRIASYEERPIPTRFHKGSLVCTIKVNGEAVMMPILSNVRDVFGVEAAVALSARIATWKVDGNPNSSAALRIAKQAEYAAWHSEIVVAQTPAILEAERGKSQQLIAEVGGR